MNQEDSERGGQGVWLIAVCCAVYFISYLTRKGYDASILAICEDTGLTRKAAGLASTAAVALYGTGQFVTGFLADKIDARKIILFALLLTACCNLAMPFATGAACVSAMLCIWAVNGFAQAMFWPPLVKIAASNLSAEKFRSAMFWVSVAANIAIISVFVLVSACVKYSGWKLTFDLVSLLALAMAVAWYCTIKRLAPSMGETRAAEGTNTGARLKMLPLMAASGLFLIMAVIVCQGVMRDGIEVWAPSIIKDQFGLETSKSIFSVALLPCFAVVSMVMARKLRRILGDEIKAATTLFGVGLACAVVLYALNGGTVTLGLLILALLSSCMHGANLMLIAELPGRFAKFGRVGAISGILNAFTYVGAAVAIYGFAALREQASDWRKVFGLWIVVLIFAIILSMIALLKWRNFQKKAH